MNKELQSLRNDIQILHELSMKTDIKDKKLKSWILNQQIRTFAKIDKIKDAEMLRQREAFFKEEV